MLKVPRGLMCCACVHALRDCSGLPFDTMRTITKHPDGVQEVKCDHFEGKKDAAKTDQRAN